MQFAFTDASGNLILNVDTDVSGTEPLVVTHQYDDLNRRVATDLPIADASVNPGLVPPGTLEQTFQYFADGTLRSQSDVRSGETRFQYDDLQRPTVVTRVNPESGNHTTSNQYDVLGRRTEMREQPGEDVTVFGYDNLGRLTTETITLPTGPASHTYEYDAFGNLEKAVDREGRIVRYQHDLLGRRTGETWFGMVEGGEEDEGGFARVRPCVWC